MSSPSQDFCSRSPYSSVFRFVHPPLVLLVSFCVKFSHSRLFEWIVLYLILFQSLVLWFFVFLLRTMPPKGCGSKTLVKGLSSKTPKSARDENLLINPPVQPPSIPKALAKTSIDGNPFNAFPVKFCSDLYTKDYRQRSLVLERTSSKIISRHTNFYNVCRTRLASSSKLHWDHV